jgi:hypothetical protein
VAATAPASRTAPAPRAPRKRAPARRPRRAPARKPAARARSTRRRQQTPIVGFVPIAAARTAGAVGGIADSGLVVRLTRGRLWIGTLATLLVGIVGLNVMALSFNSSSSDAGRAADALERQGSTLRAQLADRLSTEEVQNAARDLGLVFAAPGAIGYLKPSSDDAAEAAQRLRDGELAVSDTTPVAPTGLASAEPASIETAVPTDPAITTTDPAATTAVPAATTAPADPTATLPADPTATVPTDSTAATVPTDPTATAPATTATAGGGVTP